MDSKNARSEFGIRLFRWSLEEWERELNNGFELLRQVSGNAASKTIDILRSLSDDERRQLTHAFAKRFHKEACAALGDGITEDDLRLLRWADSTRLLSPDHQPPVAVDRGLRRVIVARLKTELESVGRFEPMGRPTEWRYVTGSGPWRIFTQIEAVGRFGDCSYSHSIETLGGRQVSQYVSLLSWLGISSQTKWRVSDEQDASDSAVGVRNLCRHFLVAAPRLLDGLAVDS